MQMKHGRKHGISANSPDLSPIEGLWAILQDKVIEKQAFTEEKMCEIVSEEWWKIPQSTIKKLCGCMPARLAKMQAKTGRHFNM